MKGKTKFRTWGSLLIVLFALAHDVTSQRLTITNWYYLPTIDVGGSASAQTLEYARGAAWVVLQKPSVLLGMPTADTHRYFELTNKNRPRITASVYTEIPGYNGGKSLMMFASAKNRRTRRILIKKFDTAGHITSADDKPQQKTTKYFKRVRRLSKGSFKNISIQGATAVGRLLVLANSPNSAKGKNHLILTDIDFYKQDALFSPSPSDVRIRQVNVSKINEPIIITGLTYAGPVKTLIFMATTFQSKKPKTYLGWISNFEDKLSGPEITPDNIVDIAMLNNEFETQEVDNVAFKTMNGNKITLIMTNEDLLYTADLAVTGQ